MRIYTKEWYNLMQGMGIDDFKKIPDGNYTDSEIDALYQKALKKEIASERRCYNSEPFFLPFDELLTEENFDPEDWIRVIDEEKGIVKHSESAKEVREELEAQYRQEMDAFENRPPFDPAETIQFFEAAYQTKLNYYKEALWLHDASLLSIKKSGKNYIMLVAKDGFWPDDATPYRRVIFHKATVIEKEAGLRVQKLESDTTFLYKEIYRTDTGYEVHMMFWMPKGLAYLTIACEDISFEDGVLFEK
jgi:hypothetical protein